MSSGMPEEGGRVEEHRGSSRFPWQVGLAVAAWVALGAALVAAALSGGGGTEGPDQASVDAVRQNLGDSAIATSRSSHPTLLLLAGLAVLLLAILLLLGQGWARYVLGVIGIVMMVLLALDGRGEAVLAFGVLVVGTVPLLAPSAHRYLAGR